MNLHCVSTLSSQGVRVAPLWEGQLLGIHMDTRAVKTFDSDIGSLHPKKSPFPSNVAWESQ